MINSIHNLVVFIYAIFKFVEDTEKYSNIKISMFHIVPYLIFNSTLYEMVFIVGSRIVAYRSV